MNYKLSTEKPPNIIALSQKFGVKWESGLIVAYGDTIHCAQQPISENKIAHELVHLRQQSKIGLEEWWDRYYKYPEFRLEQEIEAYRAERDILKTMNRSERRRITSKNAKDLSSAMYGNLISYETALNLLKNG